jgi:hypothetical protein
LKVKIRKNATGVGVWQRDFKGQGEKLKRWRTKKIFSAIFAQKYAKLSGGVSRMSPCVNAIPLLKASSPELARSLSPPKSAPAQE